MVTKYLDWFCQRGSKERKDGMCKLMVGRQGTRKEGRKKKITKSRGSHLQLDFDF